MDQGKKVIDFLEFSYSELIPRLEIKNMSDEKNKNIVLEEVRQIWLIPTLSKGIVQKNTLGGTITD